MRILQRKKERQDRLLQQPSQHYRDVVWRRFKKNRPAIWSLRLLYAVILIALLGDFLANEKPLYCRIDGKTYFPVLHQYAVDLGLAKWEARFVQSSWSAHSYETLLMPLIPYSASTIDRKNLNAKSPFGKQNIPSRRYRHWLGTDTLGRDVTAGLIHGAQTALLVGLLAMAIASLIGIVLGSLAGYFGDDQFRLSRIRLWLNILGILSGIFFGFVSRSYALTEGPFLAELIKSLGLCAGILLLLNGMAFVLKRNPFLGRKILLPLDLIVMRMIEIINSIPALLLILSVVAIIRKPSVFHVIVIIGLISWDGIARFIRAELLRIRRQEFIEAAQAMGFSHWRILRRHAIPNALTPVLITIAFGIAGAILLEAFLSFLGIGVDPKAVTWGSMLNKARFQISAWWLAVFPGFAIFLTVTLFNLIGEGLTEALDPRA